jgi:hypothetical protein
VSGAPRAGGALSLDSVAGEVRRCLDLVVHIARENGRRSIGEIMTVGRF